MASTFYVENFGCRAARADGEAVGAWLRDAGLCERQSSEAEVVIVNTCSVTAEADRAARAFIRRAHRLNPEAKIVVTGCYAQRAPGELAGLGGVAAVVGNSHKALVPEIVRGLADAGLTDAGLTDAGLTGAGQAAENNRNLRVIGEEQPSRAKAPIDFAGLMYGLKPIPFTEMGNSAFGQAPIWADDLFAHSFLEGARVVPGAQTRPNLKIQEGCGNRCSFCVIPQTRGPSKSLPVASILRQVEGFVAAGGKELVLSGINLGRWGRDFSDTLPGQSARESWFPTLATECEPQVLRLAALAQDDSKDGARSPSGRSRPGSAPRTLAALVREIIEGTALKRLRLSSIEPMDWDAELIGLMAEFGGTRLARHAHLPLQSGSDAVLRRMHRRYRPWHYAAKVEELVRAAGPELTLGADVMVGFPGETESEFEETVALVRALPFGYLHLFPFSPRPATLGWALHAERPVPAEAVAERMAVLRALAAVKSESHRRRFVGCELEAITLHTPAEVDARGRSAALTENFLPVTVDGRFEANRLARLRVSGIDAEGTLEARLPDDFRGRVSNPGLLLNEIAFK
jgi:threonylcarbamoyladenosine tRNA methylthiotransferase MtaB